MAERAIDPQKENQKRVEESRMPQFPPRDLRFHTRPTTLEFKPFHYSTRLGQDLQHTGPGGLFKTQMIIRMLLVITPSLQTCNGQSNFYGKEHWKSKQASSGVTLEELDYTGTGGGAWARMPTRTKEKENSKLAKPFYPNEWDQQPPPIQERSSWLSI